jgi:hypothetical protein
MSPLARWASELAAIPPESYARRALYGALLAVGVAMTGFGSIFMRRTGPIPYGVLPDLRPVLFLGSGLGLALYASGGGAARRAVALWGVVGYVVAFHLEEATVHWIGPFPGSITGTPVGLLGTGGSILALLGVLLMHVEVESLRLAKDLEERGAARAEARATAARLREAGVRRCLAVAATAAGFGALALAVAPVFGNNAAGGAWVLVPGAALLFVLAVALARGVPRRGQQAPASEP